MRWPSGSFSRTIKGLHPHPKLVLVYQPHKDERLGTPQELEEVERCRVSNPVPPQDGEFGALTATLSCPYLLCY
jgi:hypothetical protein